MNHWKRSFTVGVALSSLGLGLAACGSSASSTSASSSASTTAKLSAIKIGYTPGGGDPRLWVALKEGYFQKQGLNPQLVPFNNGAVAAGEALKSGAADVNLGSTGGLVSAMSVGVDLKAIYVTFDQASGVWMVAGKNSGVTSLASLKGKTVGTAFHTDAWFDALAMLKANNLTNSVKLVNVSPAAFLSALSSNSVNALVAWTPVGQEAVIKGGVKIASAAPATTDPSVYEAPASWASSHKAVVVDFIAAMQEAGQYIAAHPAEAAAIWAAGNTAPATAASTALKYITFPTAKESVTSGYVDSFANVQALYNSQVKLLLQSGSIKAIPSGFTTALDPSYVEAYLAKISK